MKRLLLVDDEEMFAEGMKKLLFHYGIETDLAANGNDGIKLLCDNHYDWVLTDIIMPERDGLEFIIMAKARFPKIKIIAMSGGGRIKAQDYLRMAEFLDAEAVLYKPFEIKSLLAHMS